MRQPPAADKPTAPDCSCRDPIACLEHMFVQMVQMGRIEKGQCPARRPVFLRLHGVAHGRFRALPGIDEKLRVGLFKPRASYPAWVRFSSDLPDGRPDLKSTVGIGIKLFGVPGKKVLPPDESAVTADFTLQNMDVFFVDNAREMCMFTKASLTSAAAADRWLAEHPKTKEILDRMEKVVPTVLGTDLWSVIPFRFGAESYCKYKLEPLVVPEGPEPDYDDPGYLAADLTTRLRSGEASFRFLVQRYVDDESTPLDRATVSWSESASPPVHVATLVLPKQDIRARGQAAYGETLAFNPARTLEVHEPVGSIAAARAVVYEASADLRRNVNGEPLGEPAEARPATIWPAAKDTRVVRAAIHPGIGVARIGNSGLKDGYFIGPEVTEPAPTPAGGHRDRRGAILRQAARFRIYGYNSSGEVVQEIDANDAGIQWTAHLANRKAQWYQFQAALDIPDAASMSVPLRNATVKRADRDALAIDPGPRTIEGANKSGAGYRFDTGTFQSTVVPLGELRTDEAGRLLVLGGLGSSGSPDGKPVFRPEDPNSFNNADGWYDDVADGPVAATVTMSGRPIPVDPAWVIVAPPDYAPDVDSWRTLYDLLVDTYVRCGWMSMPETVSFTRDILPVLRRLTNLQWVNQGFATMFGSGGPLDFEQPGLIEKLGRSPQTNGQPDPYHELRQVTFNAFRPANNEVNDPRTWPWIYGDAFGSFSADSPRNNLELPDVRSRLMQRWVDGDFVNDWDPDAEPPRSIADVPLAERPAMLDRAALDRCLADAFHPGCELTWPMRHPSMYEAPFRIRHRAAADPEPYYGSELTQEIVLRPGGPLYAQGPGDLTRWMALPWQGDTAFCRSGYEIEYDPYLPTFWPAAVPNQVLTAEDYDIVVDTKRPREERIAAFRKRANWLRALIAETPSAPDVMLKMIADFGKMGIIEQRPGVEDDPDFPGVMLVESLPPQHVKALVKAARERTAALEQEDLHPVARKRLERAGWESREQLEEFRRIRMR